MPARPGFPRSPQPASCGPLPRRAPQRGGPCQQNWRTRICQGERNRTPVHPSASCGCPRWWPAPASRRGPSGGWWPGAISRRRSASAAAPPAGSGRRRMRGSRSRPGRAATARGDPGPGPPGGSGVWRTAGRRKPVTGRIADPPPPVGTTIVSAAASGAGTTAAIPRMSGTSLSGRRTLRTPGKPPRRERRGRQEELDAPAGTRLVRPGEGREPGPGASRGHARPGRPSTEGGLRTPPDPRGPRRRRAVGRTLRPGPERLRPVRLPASPCRCSPSPRRVLSGAPRRAAGGGPPRADRRPERPRTSTNNRRSPTG